MSKQDFYHQKETSEARYTITPTNAIDVSRLLQNKPCWQQPFGDTLRTQKKLIFNSNPLWRQWKGAERLIFAERLQDLEKEGFELYAFYQGRVCRLKFVSLYDLRGVFFAETADEKTILKEAIKTLNMSPDDILILNSERYKILCDGDDEDWKRLGAFKQCDLQHSNITVDSLNHLFEQKKAEIEALDLRGCINLSGGNLGDQLPNCLKVLKLGNDTSVSSLRKNTSGSVNLNTNLNKEDIKKLIRMSKNTLKELVITGSPIDVNDIISVLLSFGELQLETLDFSFSNINSETLQGLLEKIPKLRALNLGSCAKITNFSSLLNLDLSDLTVLDLSDSAITSASLQVLLKKARNLKTLDLARCKNIGGLTSLSNLDLSNLAALDLSGSAITSASLQALLEKASKLKTLRLGWCSNARPLSLSSDLSNLEILDLSGLDITSASLQALLKKARNLKTLDLARCKNIGGPPTLSNLDLSNLETLNLSGSAITSASLQVLLEKATQLKKLDLNGCPNIAGPLSLSNLDLSNLETLNLSGSAIASASLQVLLEKARNLKTLDLARCENIEGPSTLSNLDLSNLETLDLSYSTISSELLNVLLTKARNLKVLHIDGCEIRDKSNEGKKCLLSNLQLRTRQKFCKNVTR